MPTIDTFACISAEVRDLKARLDRVLRVCKALCQTETISQVDLDSCEHVFDLARARLTKQQGRYAVDKDFLGCLESLLFHFLEEQAERVTEDE